MDPREFWLSDNFRLSDFLGCHSVYARGLPNPFTHGENSKHIANARALCEQALEPLLALSPMSITYGFISDSLSRAIVTYQDPTKPSHHRWDLGAAADIIVHDWIQRPESLHPALLPGESVHPSVLGAPVALAHAIEATLQIPYSRLITYSESPSLCIAVADEEVRKGQPRKAFYENRFEGTKRAKPAYIRLPSQAGKKAAMSRLLEHGLPHAWEGGGFPSYHGGGVRQYHHRRVSECTVVQDWLFDVDVVTHGGGNVPNFTDPVLMGAFRLAGLTHDHLLGQTPGRLSVITGYTARTCRSYTTTRGWRGDEFQFTLAHSRLKHSELTELAREVLPREAYVASHTKDGCLITVSRGEATEVWSHV